MQKNLRFHEFVAKACLVIADECQAIDHVVSNTNAMLNAEITNDYDVNSMDVCAPIWIKRMKDCMHTDDCNSVGYELSCFEPIV